MRKRWAGRLVDILLLFSWPALELSSFCVCCFVGSHLKIFLLSVWWLFLYSPFVPMLYSCGRNFYSAMRNPLNPSPPSPTGTFTCCLLRKPWYAVPKNLPWH